MKKLFYLLFFVSLCFVFNFLYNFQNVEASNQCNYYSASSKNQKSYTFNGKCPVVVDKEGKPVDLSARGVYKNDNFYILEGYNIIGKNSSQDYSGQIYFAQAIYYEENTLSSTGRYFYVTYNNGIFNVTMSPLGANKFNNHIIQQNFFNQDNTKFTAHPSIYYKSSWNMSIETVDLYVLRKDIPNADSSLTVINEVNLKDYVIIYPDKVSQENTILDVKNYCGAVGTYTATLYSNNTVKFSGKGNPGEKKLSDDEKITSLPNEICVTYYNSNGTEFSSISLGKCILEGGSTYTTDCDVTSSEDVEEETNYLNGNKFKDLLGSIKTPLSHLSSNALTIPLTIDGNKSATLNDVNANDLLCSGSDCNTNAQYYSEQGLKNIKNYCNELYSDYDRYKIDPDNIKKRMDECIGFNNFYNQLVNQGIVDNLANYCGVLSQDFAAKLKYYLKIIMVAGPLLALGLGTIDFVKVLANGDADKEMKNAFKRFVTRLGAAALLFLVPIILAFLLDLFIKPDSGYDPNNPFCDIVDWKY